MIGWGSPPDIVGWEVETPDGVAILLAISGDEAVVALADHRLRMYPVEALKWVRLPYGFPVPVDEAWAEFQVGS